MTMRADLEAKLVAALAPVRLEIKDDSDAHAGHAGSSGGAHVSVVVVSTAFEGQSRVARHRMVYAAVGDAMKQQVHALAIVARTPAEDAATR